MRLIFSVKLLLLTCMTPSHVWMPSLLLTGIVPSPDSIFVRNWPRAFLQIACKWQKYLKLSSVHHLTSTQKFQNTSHEYSKVLVGSYLVRKSSISSEKNYAPIRMLIDANFRFVRWKYASITARCRIDEQMEFYTITKLIQLIWLWWPIKNGIFCCACKRKVPKMVWVIQKNNHG